MRRLVQLAMFSFCVASVAACAVGSEDSSDSTTDDNSGDTGEALRWWRRPVWHPGTGGTHAGSGGTGGSTSGSGGKAGTGGSGGNTSGTGGSGGNTSGTGGSGGNTSGTGGSSGSGGSAGSGGSPNTGGSGGTGGSPSTGGTGGSSSTGGTGGSPSTGGSGGTGGSSGASPDGLFPAGYTFYKDVSSLPAASQSAAMIAQLSHWGKSSTDKFDITFDFHVFDANNSTPMASASGVDTDESEVVPFPVVPGGQIEGGTGYSCDASANDCHYIVIQRDTQKLFELYGANQDSPGHWSASSESVWDLTKVYGASERGFGCTSADAAGLPIVSGLIRVKEVVQDQEIKHALRFILSNASMLKDALVAPASHYGGPTSTNANAPPYGVRFRLKPSFNESTITSAGGKVVVRALKKYGMILADGGTIPLTAENDQFTTAKWGSVLGPHDLRAIQVSDFEVVDLANVQTFSSRPNCTLGH